MNNTSLRGVWEGVADCPGLCHPPVNHFWRARRVVSKRKREEHVKTLVTGGTGFTGSHLVRRLLRDGHTVTVMDNKPGLFDQEIRQAGAEVHYGDINDVELCRKLTAGQDGVFHLAAAFRGVNLPNEVYWKTNVDGTRVIGEASLAAGVSRFVYCSTEGVHGKVENPPADEDAPIAPKDYYQLTKYEGEKVVHELQKRGLATVILRPTAIYGPGDPGRYLLLYKWAKRGVFFMFGSGEVFYHPVYIDNLTDAFVLAMARPEVVGKTYLIGDAEYISLNTLVRMVGQAMDRTVKVLHFPYSPFLWASVACESLCKPLGITPPLFRRRAEWYWENRGFSIERARRELGYDPRVGLADGLAETGRWYREHGYI